VVVRLGAGGVVVNAVVVRNFGQREPGQKGDGDDADDGKERALHGYAFL